MSNELPPLPEWVSLTIQEYATKAVEQATEPLRQRIAELESRLAVQGEPVAIPDNICKYAMAVQSDNLCGPLTRASSVIDFVADYTAPQPEMQGEPTRSQKLRNAGFTRRPSAKSLPSDNMDDEQPAVQKPLTIQQYNCLPCLQGIPPS